MEKSFIKEYRLTSAKFVFEDTGKTYKVYMDKDDRFYTYMRPYIANKKVPQSSKVVIDKIIVDDKDNTFFESKVFNFNAVMLVTNIANVVQSYSFSMKGLRIDSINSSKQKYEQGKWMLELYELQIPYQTDIEIKIRED